MRLFASVGLDGLDEEIAAVQERFADANGVRLTDPERVHVTLKFLGETDPDRLDALTGALETAIEDAGVEPFRTTFGGLGAFPSTDYIRVIWVGVRDGRGDERLTRLHDAIEERTTELGFEPADHAFTPHATIARMDHASGKDRVQNVLDTADPDLGTRRVEAVRLVESVLDDDGPAYTTVDRFAL